MKWAVCFQVSRELQNGMEDKKLFIGGAFTEFFQRIRDKERRNRKGIRNKEISIDPRVGVWGLNGPISGLDMYFNALFTGKVRFT